MTRERRTQRKKSKTQRRSRQLWRRPGP